MHENEEAGRRGGDEPAGNCQQHANNTQTVSIGQAQRRRLPNRRASTIVAFEHLGHRFRASGSYSGDGLLAEVFIDTGKFGSAVQQHADNCAVLASIALQHGVPIETVRHSVVGPLAVALDLLGGA